jgi:hypothetical protein
MLRVVVIAGIIVLLLFLSLTLTYGDIGELEVVDIYALSQEYYTKRTVSNILGVTVTMELTAPKLVIHGENHTFTYKILVGDAPSGWLLNITKVVFEGYPWCFRFSHETTQGLKALKGGESLEGRFTVKAEAYYELSPGFVYNCFPRVAIHYIVTFGSHRKEDSIGVGPYLRIKTKELPLELRYNLSLTRDKSSFVRLSGLIKIRNIQSWDIILKSYAPCRSKEVYPESVLYVACGPYKYPSATIKSGKEYAIDIDESYSELPRYMAFVIEYLYPNGKAQNWLVLRISPKPSKEAFATMTQKAESPTTAATTVITTTTRPTVPSGGVPIGPGTPTYTNMFFGVLMLMVPIALVTIAAVAIATYLDRKSRAMQSRPKAEETAQGPSKPTAQSTTQVSTQKTEPSSPTSQETTQSRTAPPSQPEQPKPPQPKLQTPAWLHARSKAIISKLASAKTRIELGDLNDAILEIHKAVNATISLILEAEGLSMKGPDGKELSMSEKFRLLAERGWVSWNHRRYFIRLQDLRNRIEHDPERIHAPQTTASEVQELFRFHENFVRTSLRTLEELGRED